MSIVYRVCEAATGRQMGAETGQGYGAEPSATLAKQVEMPVRAFFSDEHGVWYSANPEVTTLNKVVVGGDGAAWSAGDLAQAVDVVVRPALYTLTVDDDAYSQVTEQHHVSIESARLEHARLVQRAGRAIAGTIAHPDGTREQL